MIRNYFRNLIAGKPVFNWQTCLAILLTSLGFNSLTAQVNEYSFSQSTGTFSSISGGTVLGVATGNASATNLNSNVYPVTIPFAFNFSGQNYTALNVSTNGFITFGALAPTATNTTPISSAVAYDGAVSAFGHDISSFYDIAGKTGDISWQTVGVAPNREVVIQWSNFRPTSITSTTSVYALSFQIRLRETTNTISVVYSAGSYLIGSTGYSSAANQVGLRGATNADFNNRFNAATTPYINSVDGTTNGDDQAFSTVNATPGMPSDGLIYTWTPATCLRPANPVISNVTTNSGTVSWTASVSNPVNGYEVYYSTTNSAPTASTTPTLTGIMGTSTPISGLAPSTSYFIWIRSACSSADKSKWTMDAAIISTACQPPAITGTSVTPTPVCPGGTATLSATADAGAAINWYDGGGTQVATGSSFTTPNLSTTTTYYTSASVGNSNLSAGKTTFTPNPTSGAGTTNFGLVFDVFSQCVLSSVTIYPISPTGAAGTVTIDVIDGNGTILQTHTENVTGSPITAPVAHIVNLNFVLAPGTNYKIRPGSRTGISGLAFDPAANATGGNYGYPFNLAGLLSINTSTLGTTPTNAPSNDLYYYFYDWKVSTKCESVQQPIVVTVDSNCLSTSETPNGKEISIYPNPFTEVINISDIKNVVLVSITDLSGRTLKTISKPTSQIYLGDLKTGMYLITLTYKDGRVNTLKAIKK